MPLMYYLSRRIHFEFSQNCDKSYMFNLTNVGLSMCVMEYSDLFLNLIWIDHDIFVWKSMKWPTWRDKVGIVLILHGGRKLWWLMCWFIPGGGFSGGDLLQPPVRFGGKEEDLHWLPPCSSPKGKGVASDGRRGPSPVRGAGGFMADARRSHPDSGATAWSRNDSSGGWGWIPQGRQQASGAGGGTHPSSPACPPASPRWFGGKMLQLPRVRPYIKQ